MISTQVPTSLCMQNKLIIHSRYCFVEQYIYPRLKGWIKMDLISLSLPLSLLSTHRRHHYSVFVPAFLFLSLRFVIFSRSRSAFSAILSHDMSLTWTWTPTHCKPLDYLFLVLTTELTYQVANSHLENDIYFEFWLTIYITMIRNFFTCRAKHLQSNLHL